MALLLRPGGRLFIRDAHPVLNSLVGLVVRDHRPDRDQQPWISGPGAATPALELPYWEDEAGLTWSDEVSYAGEAVVASPVSREWNHALSEIVMAVLDAGLGLELLAEHDSVPWEALPGLMVHNETGSTSSRIGLGGFRRASRSSHGTPELSGRSPPRSRGGTSPPHRPRARASTRCPGLGAVLAAVAGATALGKLVPTTADTAWWLRNLPGLLAIAAAVLVAIATGLDPAARSVSE